MLRVDCARWGQTPEDLRQLATSAPHQRTRERFLALYEVTQESCATQVATRTRRHPQTVMEWLHLYNTRGPAALAYRRTGGRPPFARTSRPALARPSAPPSAPPRHRR
jgi:Winged helix-turn helix